MFLDRFKGTKFAERSKAAQVQVAKLDTMRTAPTPRTLGQVLQNPSPRDKHIYGEINKRMARMYDAAVTTNLNLDFPVTITSANAEIFNSIINVRSRSRTADRDYAYAHNAVETYIDDVCGDEPFRLEMKVGKKDSSGAFIEENDTNEEIEAAWKEAGLPENCCANGMYSRSEMDWQAIAALVRDGGILYRLHSLYPYNKYKFAIEPKEIDFLDSYYSGKAPVTNNPIQFSIETDGVYNRPIAYWLFTRHPGDIYYQTQGKKMRERIPAEEMITLFDIRTRAGQFVGMSRLASVIQQLHRNEQYTIAHMTAAIWTACRPIFFTQDFPTAIELVPDFIKTAMQRAEDVVSQGGTGFGVGEKFSNMEPGTIETLPYGFKIDQPRAEFPAEGAVGFNKDNLRAGAAGCQIPTFRFTGDYSEVNFSSGRLGMQAWHDTCERLQQHAITNYRRPHFNAWLFNALSTGEVRQPMGRYKELCMAANFHGRKWPYIQPLQDAQADALKLEIGTTSRDYLIANSERGGTVEEVNAEIAAGRKNDELHGLNFVQEVTTPTLPKGPPGETQPGHEDEPPKPGKKKSMVFCMECNVRALNGETKCRECGSDSVGIYRQALDLHVKR